MTIHEEYPELQLMFTFAVYMAAIESTEKRFWKLVKFQSYLL